MILELRSGGFSLYAPKIGNLISGGVIDVSCAASSEETAVVCADGSLYMLFYPNNPSGGLMNISTTLIIFAATNNPGPRAAKFTVVHCALYRLILYYTVLDFLLPYFT